MNTTLDMRRLPIDQLKPAKYNPRKDLQPGDPAYEKIKRSLHDFGYCDPIVWNEVTGNIVGGHQRYKVLKAEGATEVDCVVVHIEKPEDLLQPLEQVLLHMVHLYGIIPFKIVLILCKGFSLLLEVPLKIF